MRLKIFTVKLKDLIFVVTVTLIAVITIIVALGMIADAKHNLNDTKATGFTLLNSIN